MKRQKHISFVFGAWCIALLSVLGCENVISPLTDDADKVFAIHGFLDMAADTQFVRVSALRSAVLAEEPGLEDVVVQSVDQNTLEVVEWSDSVIELDDGTEGILFFGLFTPISDRTYELQVLKDGILVATANTTLPETPPYFASVPTGDTLQFSQSVVVEGINGRPFEVAVQYEVSRPSENPSETVSIEYEQDGSNTLGGWQFEVFLKRDQFSVLRQVDWPILGPQLELRRVSAIVSLKSEEWDNASSPDNFENAHGFFGSIGRFELPWILAPADVGKIGYVDRQEPF
ncbi:MAG: hypothetical protein BMS9Abin05_1465 [Rhodothermia bacterium]|nr:MAG: hypothetical protein BMS9Abin05_1465 [Rhodothermia bacterium]